MSSLREAWLCGLQDADGNEETELNTIERNGGSSAPVLQLTNGVRITCILRRPRPSDLPEQAAASRTVDLPLAASDSMAT